MRANAPPAEWPLPITTAGSKEQQGQQTQ